jgi:hypothetical protein
MLESLGTKLGAERSVWWAFDFFTLFQRLASIASLSTTCTRQLEQILSLPALTVIPFLPFLLPAPFHLRPLDDDDRQYAPRIQSYCSY